MTPTDIAGEPPTMPPDEIPITHRRGKKLMPRLTSRSLGLLLIVMLHTSTGRTAELVPIRIADPVGGHIHPAACISERGTIVASYGRINHRDLRITRSTDGGMTWSPTQPFTHTVGKTYYPGSLTALTSGQLIHAWNRWSQQDNEKEPRSVLYSLSSDDGLTWSDPSPFPRDPQVRSIIRHPIVEMPAGKWLVSLSDRTFVFDPSSQSAQPFGDDRVHGLIPIVQTPRGTLISGQGLRSTDKGKTWTEISNFPNLKEQGWRHEMVCLANGWLLASEILGPGTGGERIRYRISYDDGISWDGTFEYYNPGRPIGGRACPRTVQLDAKTIGVVFYDVSPDQAGGPGLYFLRIPMARLGQVVTGWRTDGMGVYPQSKPPTQWSQQKNVLWSTKMPSRSNAQPVVVGDRVFVCAEPFTLICVDRKDGKILWQRTNSYRDITTDEEWAQIEKELKVAENMKSELESVRAQTLMLKQAFPNAQNKEEARARIDASETEGEALKAELDKLPLAARFALPITQRQYNGYTTATPTSDGNRVWAVFGNRVVVCYDLEGNRQWKHVLPDNPQAMWGHSSSPILAGEKLIVNIDGIVAFDARTGYPLWRTKYGQSWGSPVRARIGNDFLLLMANGRILRASDGKVLTRVPQLGRGSPIVDGQTAYYVGIRANGYRLPPQIDGIDKLELDELWAGETKGSEFYASSVTSNGLIYAVSTKHILNVIDAETGEIVYVKRLQLGSGPVWASLCVAGNYLFVSSRDGTTLVLRTGREYEEVARNELEFFISTPVFDAHRMYVRTNERLYCIGES